MAAPTTLKPLCSSGQTIRHSTHIAEVIHCKTQHGHEHAALVQPYSAAQQEHTVFTDGVHTNTTEPLIPPAAVGDLSATAEAAVPAAGPLAHSR